MSAVPENVAAFEHGLLRLWSFDGESETGRALIAAMREEPRDAGAAQAALGAERVDPYWLDLVALRDIADLGLAGYLRQGYDVPREQLDAANLAPQQDHVLIAPSRAFADHEQTLAPDAALTPLGVLDIHEDVGALRPMQPVETARRDSPVPAAEDREPEPGPPAGRGIRPGAILILLLIAAAFIVVVAL